MNDRFRRVPGHGDAGAPPQFVIEHPMIIVPKTQAMWRSPRRIYLDSSGKPVGHGHPEAEMLLVAEGGEIPLERAQELGLVDAEPPEAEAETAEEEPLTDEELGAIAEGRGFVLLVETDFNALRFDRNRIAALLETTKTEAATEHGRLSELVSTTAVQRDQHKDLLELANVEVERLSALLEGAQAEILRLTTLLEANDAPAPSATANDEAFDVPGLPHQAVDALKNAGLWSAEALRAKTDEELIALPGVGEASVAKIRAALGA